ncbi:MAG: DUF3524 domain-containing protein [Verrucomicrobiota bacterium]
MSPLRICLLEPFYGGSHKRWANGLAAHSQHQIEILSLPDRHWKWRMHGAAVTFANRLIDSGKSYDLILANDLMDVAVFAGLIRKSHPRTPIATYFHENQLCYPWSPRDKDVKQGRDLHYAFINYTTALASDHLYFNSNYHKNAFSTALPEFLSRYPDHQNKSTLHSIEEKSSTLHLGMELKFFDAYRPHKKTSSNPRPLIIWNHRWEYDKNPIGFFRIISAALEEGLDFDLALLGERFEEEPPYFKKAKAQLGERIIQYGSEPALEKYAQWLWRADIALTTSVQDFFGASIVEAAFCSCHPILPNRLAYPEHFDKEPIFYNSEEDAVEMLVSLIKSGRWKQSFTPHRPLDRYDWATLAPDYDQTFGRLV